MRNLRNVHQSAVTFSADLPLTATTWDISTNTVLCTFGPTPSNPIIELRRYKDHDKNDQAPASRNDLSLIASWDALCPLPDLESDSILSLHFLADVSIVCLVLAGGDIIVVREDSPPGEDKIEIVGSVDAGITAAAWSPDEELLAISTRARTLLYMTRDFENIKNISFISEDLKASRHVSVGWGKSETQFKGKRAKALRDPTMPESIDEGHLSAFDRENTAISWRGDGEFLAVNCLEPGSRRAIRVFSREGKLDSVSEPVDGLEGALSWRPAGNVMAGIQRKADGIEVVFFERNGLRHGKFELRLSREDMGSWASSISLQWNVDSSVLAVIFKDRIQLWTMGNYHYYLKQEVPIAGPQGDASFAPLSLSWHPEKNLQLLINSPGMKLKDFILLIDCR